jgi:hypothetical protein
MIPRSLESPKNPQFEIHNPKGWMPLQAESLEGASLLAPSFFGASNDGCEGPQTFYRFSREFFAN